MEISLNQEEIEKIVLRFYPKAKSVVFEQDKDKLKAILTVDMDNINSITSITPTVKKIITPEVPKKPLAQGEVNEKERRAGVMASGGGRRTIVPM